MLNAMEYNIVQVEYCGPC